MQSRIGSNTMRTPLARMQSTLAAPLACRSAAAPSAVAAVAAAVRSGPSTAASVTRRSLHHSAPLCAVVPNAVPKEGDPSKLALTLAGVTKRFQGGRTLFKDLHLSFYHGAKIGILGANGCGKSSFLKIVGGLDKEIDGLVSRRTDQQRRGRCGVAAHGAGLIDEAAHGRLTTMCA